MANTNFWFIKFKICDLLLIKAPNLHLIFNIAIGYVKRLKYAHGFKYSRYVTVMLGCLLTFSMHFAGPIIKVKH